MTADVGHGRSALATLEAPDRLGPVEAFDTYEHAQLGTPARGGVQAMIDDWAKNGLIDGGAFIDTGAVGTSVARPITDWKITVPRPVQSGSPLLPYAEKDLTEGARWHWIGPNSVFGGSGSRWDPRSLKAALFAGDALALNIGQLVFMSGDLVPSFDDLKNPNSFAIAPAAVGTMRGYEQGDPYAWALLNQLSPSPRQPWHLTEDLRKLSALSFPRTVEQFSAYEAMRKAFATGNLPDWAKPLQSEVALLRRLRGDRPYRELHILAQTLWLRSTLSKADIVRQAPWISASDRLTLLAKQRQTYDDRFLQEVLTNGRYLALAYENADHFSPGNWQRFSASLRDSLRAVEAHVAMRTSPHPIPADAVARLACGLHFLTDAFSAGHMRVPRADLKASGSAVAKIMHDVDGRMGLNVQNGFGKVWRAFGDNQLHGPTSPIGKELFRNQLVTRRAGEAANFDAARAAVSAAIEQLRHHAQSLRKPYHAPAAFDASSRMAAEDRVRHLELYRPKPLPVGEHWDVGPGNHPPLVETGGRIDGGRLARAGFGWSVEKLGHVRRIVVTLPSSKRRFEAYDATDLYQIVEQRPDAAQWSPRETKLAELLARLPEQTIFDIVKTASRRP